MTHFVILSGWCPGLFRVKEGATFRPSHLASLRMGQILPICGFGDSFTHRFTYWVGGGAL